MMYANPLLTIVYRVMMYANPLLTIVYRVMMYANPLLAIVYRVMMYTNPLLTIVYRVMMYANPLVAPWINRDQKESIRSKKNRDNSAIFDRVLKGIVVDQTCTSINGGPLKLTSTQSL